MMSENNAQQTDIRKIPKSIWAAFILALALGLFYTESGFKLLYILAAYPLIRAGVPYVGVDTWIGIVFTPCVGILGLVTSIFVLSRRHVGVKLSWVLAMGIVLISISPIFHEIKYEASLGIAINVGLLGLTLFLILLLHTKAARDYRSLRKRGFDVIAGPEKLPAS